MLKRNLLLFIISIALITSSCKKESWFWKKAEGKVLWTGYKELDGCGYVIVIDDESYIPTDLPKEFEVDLLKIKFKYKRSHESAVCSFQKQPTIEIKDIETSTE